MTWRSVALGCVLLVMGGAPARVLASEPAPSLSVTSLPTPTDFDPGNNSGVAKYDIRIANIGGAATSGPLTITDTLPIGLTVHGVSLHLRSNDANGFSEYGTEACVVGKSGEAATVTCKISAALPGSLEPEILQPAEERRVLIQVDTPNTSEGSLPLDNEVTVEGGGAPGVSVTSHNEVSAKSAPAGLSYLATSVTNSDGSPSLQGAFHPFQFNVSFAVNTRTGPPGGALFVPSGGDIKDIEVTLPPGLVGNLASMPRCTQQQFTTTHTVLVGSGSTNAFFTGTACPDNSAIGLISVEQVEGQVSFMTVPLYNLLPPPGMPAEFGAQILNLPFYISTEVLSNDKYKVVATLKNLTQIKRLTAATTTIWGTPADPIHDPVRGSCLNEVTEVFPIEMPTCQRQEALPPYEPALRLPTSCNSPLDFVFSFDTWTAPGSFLSQNSNLSVPSDCNKVPFEPAIEIQPTTNVTDSPTGLHADVHVPQGEDSESLGQADLRKTVVKLPRGLAVNPSGANGLEACSPAQVGLISGPGSSPPSFSAAPAACPPAAMVGTAVVHTPLIDHPLAGKVYVATPHENPFGSLLALYIAVDDPLSGVVVKLAGQVEADQPTGQLTATFDETPQTPFEDFELDFFGGRLAALRSPGVCGTYDTETSLTPWSAPASGPPAAISDQFSITRSADGSACPTSEGERPNSPAFTAGSVDSTAAAYTPFLIHLRREDGSQEFSSLSVNPPPGLLAKLSGVPYCPDSALAEAAEKPGAVEKDNPSCPAASQVGTVSAGAGAGPSPFYEEGKAYLAGPYKGAPLSLAAVTPAVAGPYDLGSIVVRVALQVDPETAQVRAVSDPIPNVLQGIPLDVRSLLVKLDRPEFILNPTNCSEKGISGQETSTAGAVAPVSSRFQASGCAGLRFKPGLALSLKGGTKRGKNPALRAVLSNPRGVNANLAGLRVTLPHALFLDNEHIGTICTRVQFAAQQCPKRSVYGHARAYSPLLAEPLEGPVYLRSSSNPLPDLVADLNGQIPIVVDGRIDAIKGRMRSTFSALPDAPVSKFIMELDGGKRGLLVTSTDLCVKPKKATVHFEAQNGKELARRPVLKTSCPRH